MFDHLGEGLRLREERCVRRAREDVHGRQGRPTEEARDEESFEYLAAALCRGTPEEFGERSEHEVDEVALHGDTDHGDGFAEEERAEDGCHESSDTARLSAARPGAPPCMGAVECRESSVIQHTGRAVAEGHVRGAGAMLHLGEEGALVGVEVGAKPGPIALLLDASTPDLFRAPDTEESANPAGGHGATSARSIQTNSGRVMRIAIASWSSSRRARRT